MSDDRTNDVSTRFLGQPRRRAVRWPAAPAGRRLARLCGISAVSCLIALTVPLALPSAAVPSPLPPWVATSHRHDPGAPGGATRSHGTGPFGPGFGSLGTALVGSAPAGAGPSQLAFDPATHTLYVANGDNDNGPIASGDTVSVIDTRHCNADDVSRCRGPWPTVIVGNRPSTLAIDQATETVYVTDTGDNTVSVFNGATCNAADTSGCGQTAATVPVGLGQSAFSPTTSTTPFTWPTSITEARVPPSR